MFTPVQEAAPNVTELALWLGLVATGFLAIKDYLVHRRARHARDVQQSERPA